MKNLILSLAGLLAWGAMAEGLIETFPTRGHLTRTFAQMAASTAEKPATLRVLFYGQSIVRQNAWCEMVIDDWKRRFPTVKFVVKNLAIGGYTTDALSHCIESDIFPFYPDVLFFHDYGDVTGGYGHILGEVRKRTTAEIVVWSSHLRFDEKPDRIMNIVHDLDPANGKWDRDVMAADRTKRIRALADDLDLVFVDLQGNWCNLLLANKWSPKKLIGDSIHMNNAGFPHYSKILIDNLTPGPADASTESSGRISRLPFAEAAKVGKNGDITVAFDGNRIAAISNGRGFCDPALGQFAPYGEVLIDGVPVRDIPSQWIFTRSSPINNWFPGCDTPMKGKTALQDERWTLTVTSYVTNAKPKYVTYRVEGSKTGFDGEGCSTNTFVSKSGRVVIPGPWLASTCNPWKIAGPRPEVSKTYWNSVLVSAAYYGPRPAGEETVLAQGLTNGKHVLTIRNPHGELGIGSFVVNKPNPKWDRPPSEAILKFRKSVFGGGYEYSDSKWH